MAKTPRTRRPSSRKNARVEIGAEELDAVEAGAAAEGGGGPGPVEHDPHVAKAFQYIEDVLSGKTPACKYVRQACQRQRDDIDRYKDHELYFFDEAAAGRVCRFLELLPHIQGDEAFRRADGTWNTVVLQPWQCFIITTVFGWRRKDTGGRRYRKAYVEVPRGNGKSFLLSGVAIYGLTSDGEEGPENYSAATTREQSAKVFDIAKAMLRKKPEFAAKIGAVVLEHKILCPKNNGEFFALSREAGRTGDGKNPHVAVVDELHAHKTRAIFDVLKSAMKKRTASLLFVITTAGFDTAGICYEVRSFCVKMLAGEASDESQFAVIYTVDEGDDWLDEMVWRKANPNWGISVQPDSFASDAAQAAQIVGEQANFKTKQLNVWCNADRPWMDMAAWDRCGDPNLDRSQFPNQTCTIGLDLASKVDIAAKATLFWKEIAEDVCTACGYLPARHPVPIPETPEGPAHICAEAAATQVRDRRHYYLFADFYLPAARVNESKNSQYKGWVREGWIKTTPGDVTDFTVIQQDVVLDRERFVVHEVGYDEWQAQSTANTLSESGLTMVKIAQKMRDMSAPMKEVEACVIDGRFHHDCNPAMRWMVSNVVAQENEERHVLPTKMAPENKIDGPVAAFMAMNRGMVAVAAGSVYETRGVRTI